MTDFSIALLFAVERSAPTPWRQAEQAVRTHLAGQRALPAMSTPGSRPTWAIFGDPPNARWSGLERLHTRPKAGAAFLRSAKGLSPHNADAAQRVMTCEFQG